MEKRSAFDDNKEKIMKYMKDNGYNAFFVSNDCEYAKKLSPDVLLEKFISLCEHAIDVKKRKGHDYGNVFEQTFGDYGLLSPIMRFRDKMGRIETLMKVKSNQVTDESIKDTILDLGNYCFMTAALIECIDEYKANQAVKQATSYDEL